MVAPASFNGQVAKCPGLGDAARRSRQVPDFGKHVAVFMSGSRDYCEERLTDDASAVHGVLFQRGGCGTLVGSHWWKS